MINEVALRDTLLAFATENRSSYVMMSSLLNELAALRETVRALDPTFAEVLEQKRKHYEKTNADIVQPLVAGYNEIIRRLEAGEVC